MYGEGWVWIATDGATSLFVGDDSDVNLTTTGFIGVSPQSMHIIPSTYTFYRKHIIDSRIKLSLISSIFFSQVSRLIDRISYVFIKYLFFLVFTGRSIVDVLIAWYGTGDEKSYPGKVWRNDQVYTFYCQIHITFANQVSKTFL